MPDGRTLVDDDQLAGLSWEDFSSDDHVRPELFACENAGVFAEDGVGVDAVLRAEQEEDELGAGFELGKHAFLERDFDVFLLGERDAGD